MNQRLLTKLALQAGELVVSATYWRDSIIVVTDRGNVYQVDMEDWR